MLTGLVLDPPQQRFDLPCRLFRTGRLTRVRPERSDDRDIPAGGRRFDEAAKLGIGVAAPHLDDLRDLVDEPFDRPARRPLFGVASDETPAVSGRPRAFRSLAKAVGPSGTPQLARSGSIPAGSVQESRIARSTWSAVASGWAPKSKAANPAMCGVAIGPRPFSITAARDA
jgi:hypothetical protein